MGLSAAAHGTDGVLVQQLVRHLGETRSVRASLSRALRRLWARGLVELHNSRWPGHGKTLTSEQTNAREVAARAEADPEAFYQGAVGLRKALHSMLGSPATARHIDPWGSAGACVAAKVRQASETPRLRVKRVTITALGHVTVNSVSVSEVNHTRRSLGAERLDLSSDGAGEERNR